MTSLTEADTDPAKESAATRKRKLHLGHIAFMRAVVQGLDTRESWERYLRLEGEHDDIRNVRRTLQWMRDEFAAAAKRHDRPGIARLVQIDVSHFVDRKTAVPTLEEFAARHGLDEFSEAEQIEQYQERYGAATARESRRSRLIARQLDALLWLEGLVVQPPQAGDMLSSWLNPDLARYLEQAQLFTVAQLVERINGIGLRWWAGIRAIGASKAERILEWLRMHESTIGLVVGHHVQAKRSSLTPGALHGVVPKATAILPIHKFIFPPELDGSAGMFRAPAEQCQLDAENDYQAVCAWLRAKPGLTPEQRAVMKRRRGVGPDDTEAPDEWLSYLSNTQRAYLKEAERFLLWAVIQRNKPLSSMTPEDCDAYRAFLGDPSPRERWCGPRGRGKWSPLWRPFEGPLSASAQRHAVKILASLYQFLVAQAYLTVNPWAGASAASIPPQQAAVSSERSLTRAQWRFVERQLDMLPPTSANQRLGFALYLIYGTGIRLAEAVGARADDLGLADRQTAQWELRLQGKGKRKRSVPLPPQLMSRLSDYFASRGLAVAPDAPENRGAFLLGKATDIGQRAPWTPRSRGEIDPKQGIAPGTLYDQMKSFFAQCARDLSHTDPASAARLAAASTHWLRHTHGAHAAASGVSLDALRQHMGHASLQTTAAYASQACDGESESA
jgi:site-specific recombinase XerD